jgi:adenylate cyclase
LVGDTVNIASRVEAYCRTLGAAVLVTDAFMQALLAEGGLELAEAFTDEGLHMLRGRKEPIHLFSLRRDTNHGEPPVEPAGSQSSAIR